MESFSIAPPGGGSRSRKPNDPLLGHCDLGAVAAGVRFHHWRLGFRQFSFRPITRVLQDHVFSVFQHLPLLGHAVFPSGFRLQVNPMTQKRPSEFLLTESGIQHYVPRRTFSKYPALQWTYLMVSVGLRVGCPAWIATWQRLQTTNVLRFRAAIVNIQFGRSLRPFTLRSASFRT